MSVSRPARRVHSAVLSPADAQDRIWDFAVFGTGAGGAAAGYNLARHGHSVLFVERGALQHADNTREHLSGRWLELAGTVDFTEARLAPYERSLKSATVIRLGCGTGGSTALFGMVMERFRPVDFVPGRSFEVAPGTNLPEEWPIQYEELAPFYDEAEKLFRVRGTSDPLAPPRPLLMQPPARSDAETFVEEALIRSGLHPYRMPIACEAVPGCDGCFHKICSKNCRNDAGSVFVRPALERHDAHILPNCRVVRLEADRRTVQRAFCMSGDCRVSIRARVFMLALHAALTPALLLRSTNDFFPAGLGNTSGMVGRNLMLHVSDAVLVRFPAMHGSSNAQLHHGLSLNDFYLRDGVKLGNVHAHALDSYFASLAVQPDAMKGAVLFQTITEDFPYSSNQITPVTGNDDDVRWVYRYPDDLRLRSQRLVGDFSGAIASRAGPCILRPQGLLNGGHACGTCRFGNDPRTSALNRDNRMHDLGNVFVIDGSFFPSSGGINPSLTIIANSLRVTTRIACS